MEADGSNAAGIGPAGSLDETPAWSPDGLKIAWPSERDGRLSIFLMEAATGGVRRLTTLSGEGDSPAWSPDGRRICFVSDRDGFKELYTVGEVGHEVRRLTGLRGAIDAPSWSPFLPPLQ